jgi:hypothetical protein
MPIAAAEKAACYSGKKFEELEIDDIWHRIRFLLPGESYSPDPPSVDNPQILTDVFPSTGQIHDQALWSWKHDENEPAVLTDVTCRVRHASYMSFVVLSRVEFGYEAPGSGAFEPLVRITLASGDVVDFPLTKDFVDSRWVVYAGYLPEDATPLWRLESILDKSLVIPFVYELDVNNKPRRWRDLPLLTEEEKAARAQMEEAEKELSGANRGVDPSSSDTCVPEEVVDSSGSICLPGPSWSDRITSGDLMPGAGESHVVAGSIPSTPAGAVGAPRVMIVLSFATCCERNDYDPGGLGAAAKFFPQILVRANVPLKKIEATIRLDRPEATTSLENKIGDGPVSCCKPPYDQAKGTIGALMLTDFNGNPSIGPTAFWGNIFGYYQTDAFKALGNVPMHVVRKDRPVQRVATEELSERDFQQMAPWDSPDIPFMKVPRQGEFDNIHMAPKLALQNVSLIGVSDGFFGVADTTFPIDDGVRALLKLDDITMAPICAHDCFHMHWRWTTDGTTKWSLGWDEVGPHRVPGATMVPLNQDVFLTLRSPHEMSYHVVIDEGDIAVGEGSTAEIPANAWQVVMHHGGGYPSAADRFLVTAAQTGTLQEMLPNHPATKFYRQKGEGDLLKGFERVYPWESSALFYWSIRYSAFVNQVGTLSLRERVRVTPENLLKLRDL